MFPKHMLHAVALIEKCDYHKSVTIGQAHGRIGQIDRQNPDKVIPVSHSSNTFNITKAIDSTQSQSMFRVHNKRNRYHSKSVYV